MIPQDQIARLGLFLTECYPDEVFAGGAIDTAIAILQDHLPPEVPEPTDFSPYVEFEEVLTRWHSDVDHDGLIAACRHPLCAGWHVLLSEVTW